MMKALQKIALRHMERQVADPALRAKLTPTYVMGCKRILPSNDWYPALATTERRADHRRHPRRSAPTRS